MTSASGGVALDTVAARLDVDASDRADAIRIAGQLLVDAGCVTPGYVEAAVAREEAFPTALPTQPEAIAVPHADPDGVIAPAVAFIRLRRPAEFIEMATEDHVVPVRLVMLLALQSKDQASILGAVVRALQHGGLLEFLGESASGEAVAARLRAVVEAD